MTLSTYDIFDRGTPILDIPILEYQYSYPGFITSFTSTRCLRTYLNFLNGVRKGIGRAVKDTFFRCGRAGYTSSLLSGEELFLASCLVRHAEG
ncbi:hypothetical protein KC19_5G076800 [Ceratodon purpureus]|uniref:Uncharacterized protein n=1 Tax=Ceratodon purpureus TaxID=3225 RepID=A0A8T0I157_CERPU|nr:hypothetical protein KC19_5G076800 [Ceratodon purpureus]